MTDQGTGLIKTSAELLAPRAPVQIPGAPAPPQQIDWGAIQAQEGAQQASADQLSAEQSAAEQARIEALREEYGAGETVATKFLQGALDALLAPGALVGAGAESAGELFRNEALRDFGRGLGEAASGREALKALRGGITALTDDALAGAQASDLEHQRIMEQQEARPLLSTISRMAGMSATAVGLGVGAAGHSGVKATIAANTVEGMGGGAQVAYENSAPLRDVLSSVAIGGVLGGALTAGGEAVAHVAKRAPDLARVFGDKVQDFADSRALKAVIDRDPKAWKMFTEKGPERVARVAERIRAADILGKSDEGMLEALNLGAHEAGDNLAKVAKHLDDSGIVPQVGALRERLMQQVDELGASGSGTLGSIAESVKRETAPFFEKLAIKQADDMGTEVVVGYRNPSFTELRTFKQAIGAAKAAHMRSNSIASDEMRRLYGNVAETLNEAAEQAGPGVSRLWKESNEAATDFITLRDALENQITRKAKNRFISPSDYGTSIAAGLATAVMSGNPIIGGLTAIGSALGHKALREGGSALVSSLANRFARMSRHVPLSTAGGPEAQQVLSAIARTKAFVEETAERAGSNPTLRQAASESAKQVSATELGKKAGKFDPTAWHQKPLNPLQKVLYRKQVLGAASVDLSKATTEVAKLIPELPDEMDLKRLRKLTRDADGTEAIGSLQRLAAESASAVPGTPTGDAGGVALRRLVNALDRAEPADAISAAHQAANWFKQSREFAQDDISREFTTRVEQAIRSELSQPHWGQAGIEYGKLAGTPHPALEALSDAAKVRELLRGSHGALKRESQALHGAIAAANDARVKLTGEKRADTQTLKQFARLFEMAEEAVTLDGKPMALLFEASRGNAVHSGVGALASIDERTVEQHVEKGLEKIAPLLDPTTSRRAATLSGSMAQVREISREDYDKRMKAISSTVACPDATSGYTMQAAIAPDVGSKMSTLMQDIPKPSPSVHGKVFETLSWDDLRLANAMWEATTEPMSVFDDLAAGELDPDKAAYAWKQYPGLQKAAQAGVIDVLMGMPDEKRSEVPDTVLTQVDSALGFGGKLQDANEPTFAARMSQLYQPPPPMPKPGGNLDTAAAEPTYTQRLAGSQ